METYAAVDSKPGEKFEAPAEYWRYTVQDPLGQEIGSVETLFVNGGGEPQYIRVKIGRLWPRFVLLPTVDITLDKARRVLVLGAKPHA